MVAELSDGEGAVTTVEITLGDRSAQVAEVLADLVAAVRACAPAGEMQVAGRLGLPPERLERDVVLATAASALRTAVAQLDAARAGVSLHRFLGAESTASVELYANINRALHATGRTPADFARAADRAARAGFRSLKCAPFDEVSAASPPDRILSAAAAGLARLRAVRSAIGPAARLLVDCHSRFTAATAPVIAAELAQLGVGLVRGAGAAAHGGGRAGFDRPAGAAAGSGRRVGIRMRLLRRLLDSGAVSIIMPDIKHCGGVGEAVRAGRSALHRGGAFSLHSPSGPISLLASAHATAAVPGALPLEHAVGEVDWRAGLITPAERIEGGRRFLPPAAGLGATLDWRAIRRRSDVWTP